METTVEGGDTRYMPAVELEMGCIKVETTMGTRESI